MQSELETTTTMKMELMELTPALATRWLETNAGNRKLTTEHVEYLADQMKAGGWKLTGDPIKLSRAGRLLDGQHRLNALIKAEATLEFWVATNCEDSIFDVLDTGRVRKDKDIVSIYTSSYPREKAALVKNILFYEGKVIRKYRLAPAVIHDYVKAHDLTIYVEQGVKWYDRCRLLTKLEWCYLYWLLYACDTDEAYTFLNTLSHGTNIKAVSPVAVLRHRLEQSYGGRYAFSSAERIGYVTKAWNAHRKNERIEQLRYNPDKEGIIKPL